MEGHPPARPPAVVQWLGETWAARLAQVIQGMGTETVAVECQAGPDGSEPAAPADKALLWEQGFDLAAGATAWVSIPEGTWNLIGGQALRAAGVEETTPEEVRSTCQETLSQCSSLMAQALGERQKRTVNALPGREAEALPGGVAWLLVRVGYTDAAPAPLYLAFAPPLVEALVEPEPEQAQPPAPRGETAVSTAGRPAQPSATLDLLRDVELPVSVSFGKAQMALRDVLKLTAGSVIELDRSINEPVALIVNNTVVALGDVVVIDGNYGLRIQQIMSREKLLRSSGVA